jgi:hypothetical protein
MQAAAKKSAVNVATIFFGLVPARVGKVETG